MSLCLLGLWALLVQAHLGLLQLAAAGTTLTHPLLPLLLLSPLLLLLLFPLHLLALHCHVPLHPLQSPLGGLVTRVDSRPQMTQLPSLLDPLTTGVQVLQGHLQWRHTQAMQDSTTQARESPAQLATH